MEDIFFNRDLSWLSFNERVLLEAAGDAPLIERIRFLSIYSSNLDEFYRVRMPALRALNSLGNSVENDNERLPDPRAGVYDNATAIINRQQRRFGQILTGQIIPMLREKGIVLVYDTPIPAPVQRQAEAYFFTALAAFIERTWFTASAAFFPVNNSLYILVTLVDDDKEEMALVNVPSDKVSRFFTATAGSTRYILFIEDIITAQLSQLFPGKRISGAYNIKITRDAELDLSDEYEGDIAERIERQINQRDLGPATRLLYPPGMPLRTLQTLIAAFNLFNAGKMQGGNYHNLKDLFSLPVDNAELQYPIYIPAEYKYHLYPSSLFDEIRSRDILVSTPYDSYDTILRFFNEAAIDPDVEEVYTTLYRVANDSKIVHALMSAVRNGKKVQVFVELKARFDEANNIKWAKKMKEAGVKIIYSIPGLKVHAKTALVKKRENGRITFLGLLATGNLNENTARFYTDHILLTADHRLLRELELLFVFLAKRKKPSDYERVMFNHLLVAQFNLQNRFLALIDQEINNKRKGLSSGITIKMNNLEEHILIAKLYEASRAGVRIHLIVRSINCLVPGIAGMSENITVTRIVDRYLEHGRIFIFHNSGEDLVFLGSADWMNRNIYRRIEVCFPVYDEAIKKELRFLVTMQLKDDVAAVMLNEQLDNVPFTNKTNMIRSQEAIAFHRQQQIGSLQPWGHEN